MRRGLTLVVLVAVLAAPAEAQSGRFPRKWLIAGVGALVSGAIAGVYAATFETDIGGCSSAACVVPVSVSVGALIGFMIGSELDNLYELRYRHAPPMSLRGTQLPLAVEPQDLTLRQQTVFVTGTEAVEVVGAGPELTRVGLRARGLRGIGPIASDPATNTLLVGTTVGLYRFPLGGEEAGSLAYPGEISALSRDGGRLAVGLGPGVQVVRVGDSLTAVGEPIAEDARVMALDWGAGQRLWVLTEERLAAYDVSDTSAAILGSFTFPAIPRRIAFAEPVAMVAAGSGGVYAIDVQDPSAPAEITNWGGARFVYDVAVIGDRVYVAAGPEGLYVLRYGPGGFAPVGLARNVGFVAAVEAGPDAVYLLDRAGFVLRRIAVPRGTP